MALQKQMQLWNHAAIRVLDIRRSVIQPGDSAGYPQLPASMFLYACSGRGQIRVDGIVHTIEHSYVCHAGKGASMDIARVTEPINYFLIFYKAVMSLPCRQELLNLYRDHNPFQTQYGFVPVNSLPLYAKIEQMHRQWQLESQLEKFHVRALFHQLVYEMIKQLHHTESTSAFQTDFVSQAILYIEEHYAETFGLQHLADLLACSTRQLQRLFKNRYQMGPMEYLIQVRMNHAQAMLLNTHASIKEIAEAVGFVDFYYFSRSFKKHFGVSPLHYRSHRRINPSAVSQNSICLSGALSYSNTDNENHYHYKYGGVQRMQKRMKTMLALNSMLIFLLLLGACSSGGGGTGNISGERGPAVAQSATASPSPSPAQATENSYPVTIEHVKGKQTLEQKPERIVVLDVQFLDQLVTLNEQPVGSVKAAGSAENFPKYLVDKLTDVTVLGTYQEPNLEAIVSMNPDFIICTEVHEAIYEKLSKIAPTVMFLRNDDWRDTLATFGKIVGKERDAEQVLQAYKEKTAKLAGDLAAKLGGQNVALIRPRDDMVRVHTPGHRTGAILYDDLGLHAPPQVVKAEDTAYPISLEALADIGADHYFLLTDDMFKGLVQEFQRTTTWQSLEPVKNHRVYTVDTTMWIGYYGPMAINLVVDQVADALLGTS